MTDHVDNILTVGSMDRLMGMHFPAVPGHAPDIFRSLHDSILRAAHDAILTVDQHQRIVMINPVAQRMFGCTAQEALGTELSRFIPPEFRAAHALHVQEFDASDAGERPMSRRGPITGLRSNGERFPAEATITRVDVSGAVGNQRYFTALIRDLSVTEGLHAEVEALKRRMLRIFEMAPAAIWITENERVMFANHACETLFGSGGPAGLVGRSIFDLLHAESHAPVRRAMQKALEMAAPPSRLRERIVKENGDIRLIEIALAPLWDDGRSALQMVLSDVTDEARAANDLRDSREHLRRVSATAVEARERERLRMAHELHEGLAQNLVAIHMQLSALHTGLPAGQAMRVDAVLAMTADAVASVRRIASELHPLILEDLGLRAALESLIRETRPALGAEVTLDMGRGSDEITNGAAIALYRMVQEALTRIAHQAHGPRIHISITIDERELRLIFEDADTDLAPAVHREVFSRDLPGTVERVALFHGQAAFDTAPGGGWRITVVLPREAIMPNGSITEEGARHAPQ